MSFGRCGPTSGKDIFISVLYRYLHLTDFPFSFSFQKGLAELSFVFLNSEFLHVRVHYPQISLIGYDMIEDK